MSSKFWMTLGITSLLSLIAIPSAQADSLSSKKSELAQKQKQSQQLQSQIHQTQQRIAQQKQKTQTLQLDVHKTEIALQATEKKIQQVQASEQQLQTRIDALNVQITQTQQQVQIEQRNLQDILLYTYEHGRVSYLAVLFQANSFSDFITRVHTLSLLAKSQQQDLNSMKTLNQNLSSQENEQNRAIASVKQKEQQLQSLRTHETALEQQNKHALLQTSQQVSSLQTEEDKFSKQMHLTQQQVKDLKQQIAEQEAIMNSKSGNVVETALQYHDVSAQKLYDFVQTYDKNNVGYASDFTVSDMKTIIQAGKNYNVNPILLVAITGAEESFVPTKFPIHSYWANNVSYIHNNPFNVYYSWAWTKDNRPGWRLSDTANIAANTVRHKLSTAPRYGDNVFQWLNDPRNPWGLYATDRAWAGHVAEFYQAISNFVNAK